MKSLNNIFTLSLLTIICSFANSIALHAADEQKYYLLELNNDSGLSVKVTFQDSEGMEQKMESNRYIKPEINVVPAGFAKGSKFVIQMTDPSGKLAAFQKEFIVTGNTIKETMQLTSKSEPTENEALTLDVTFDPNTRLLIKNDTGSFEPVYGSATMTISKVEK